MSNELENVNLSGNALDVCDIHNPVLFKDFDGYLLAGGDMGRQFHLAECALS